MPTQTPARANTETWLALLPEGAPEPLMITRDELLGALDARGVDVNEGRLIFWEKAGILPRPTRRWHGGGPRAMYPAYAIDAVEHLRQLQAAGRTLEQIAPIMRTWAVAQTDWRDHLSGPLTQARDALYEVARLRGIKASGIRFAFTDDAGNELWSHELTIPGEWG